MDKPGVGRRAGRDIAIRNEHPVDTGIPLARNHKQVDPFRPVAEIRHHHQDGLFGHLPETSRLRKQYEALDGVRQSRVTRIVLVDNDTIFLDGNERRIIRNILIHETHRPDFHMIADPK